MGHNSVDIVPLGLKDRRHHIDMITGRFDQRGRSDGTLHCVVQCSKAFSYSGRSEHEVETSGVSSPDH